MMPMNCGTRLQYDQREVQSAVRSDERTLRGAREQPCLRRDHACQRRVYGESVTLIRSCALPHRIPSPTLTCAPMLHAHLHQRLGSRNAVEVPFSFSPASGRLMLRGASSWRHVNIGSGTLMLWDHGAAIADRSGGQRHGGIAVA